MAENGEAPKILIASKGMPVSEMRSRNQGVSERASSSDDFWQVQNKLLDLVDNPDKNKEDALKLQRARLINEAKEVGVLDTIKPLLIDIQTKYQYGEAFEKIQEIDVNRLENEAKGIRGWKDGFSGIISHYRDGALRNMEIAFLETTGNENSPRATSLKKEKDLLGWGAPPAGLDLLVKPKPESTNTGMDPKVFAKEFAEAQGIMTADDYLEIYRSAEEYLKTPFQIVPGQEPRFWPKITEKEKNGWYIRSSLVTAAYKKSMATGTDKLYMDEGRELAIDINKRALKVLFGARNKETGEVEYEGMDGVLPAVGIYSTIIGDKRFLRHNSPDDLSLKQVFCDIMPDTSLTRGLEEDYGPNILEDLRKQEDLLYKSCPDSMYPHDPKWGTSINQEAFRQLRLSIRFWLVTKGRDLLLNDQEMSNRAEFFSDKDKAYADLSNRAREAEQVAWNFVYSAGLLESFDSRDYRPAGTKRHGPSNYWTLFLWTPMHIQERFEQKIVRGNKSSDLEAKEEWAGNLGTWALNNYQKGNWTVRLPNGGYEIKFPQILPNTIFRSALHNKQVFQVERDRNGRPNENKDGDTFFGIFNKIGNEVLFDTNSVNRKDIESRINWDRVSDSPFVPYIYDEMRWADVVQQLFKKGRASKISLSDFGEAARNLRISTEDREKILMVYYGNNVNSSEMKPTEDPITWGMRKKALKEYAPNLFLER